jgi:Protein of unknown function (DUF3999)
MRLDMRFVFTAAFLAFMPGVHAASATDYAYAFPLHTTEEAAAFRVELTPEVYAGSRREANLRDIVVVNAQGREVPFAVLSDAPPVAHEYSLKTRLLPVPAMPSVGANGVRIERSPTGDIVIDQRGKTDAAGPTQWLIDARKQVTLTSLRFDTLPGDEDIQIHLAVDASNDLQHWELRTGDAVLVSVKRGEDNVDQRTIDVGGEPARYYRLRLTDGNINWTAANSPEVTLSGTETNAAADRDASRIWLTLDAVTGAHPGASPSTGTDYDYRLPAALPIEAARVVLTDANTVARFSLLAHSDPAWLPLTTLTAVQLSTRDKGSDIAAFSAGRTQELRLHTDTPLARAPQLAVAWRPDVFVFLADGPGPYRLLVGSYANRRADYPIDEAIARLRAGQAEGWQPPRAVLGEMSEAGGKAALEAPKVPYDWTRPLLWLVLIGGALLVAGMAFSLLRQSKGDNTKS